MHLMPRPPMIVPQHTSCIGVVPGKTSAEIGPERAKQDIEQL
jgi:hypothetical protein